MEEVKMDETKLEKNDYSKSQYGYDGEISNNDFFLAEHYKELFYMTPKELAMAINSMPADKLFQFIFTVENGEGMNVDLIKEKLDELGKYQNLDWVFMQAWFLLILKDFIDCTRDSNTDKETFCRAHKEIKKIWSDENEHQRKEKTYNFLNTEANIEPQKIIKDLIDAGQLDPVPMDSKYRPYKSMPQFIQWCFDNNYGDDISKQFIWQNIYFRGNSLRSIEIYINTARKMMQ
jgi:hypothetical protein